MDIKTFKEVIVMPGRDGTGPQGIGAMTGRGLGVCHGVNATMYGQGPGQGRGRGVRAGNRVSSRNLGSSSNTAMQGSEMQEISEDVLKTQKEELLKRVELINKQLNSNTEEKK
jgi:hypothetical protein